MRNLNAPEASLNGDVNNAHMGVRVPPRVYFAGVAQHYWCSRFVGHRVLESFANVRPLMDDYRPVFQSMALDSGAYTEMTTGRPVDLGAYVAFCQQHGRFYDFIASLDSIQGGVKENQRNWQRMRDAGIDAVPTFHQGEPIEWLQELCSAAPMVGLGFQRPIEKPADVEWLETCFSNIPERVRVHGWAMTSYLQFPFWSVDSRSWFFEYRSLLSLKAQGAFAIREATPPELLQLVINAYVRRPAKRAWDGTGGKDDEVQLALFTEEEVEP